MDVIKKGSISVLVSFLLWGSLPIFWKLLSNVPSLIVLANRIIWTLVFCFLFLAFQKKLKNIHLLINSRKELCWFVFRSILLGINWFVFVWGINNNYILECSLGYFINPLMIILIGFIFLNEKLNKVQILSLLLSFMSVVLMIVCYGKIPLIALSLALTFALYTIMKKNSKLDAISGLLFDMGIIIIPALIYLYIFNISYVVNSSLSTHVLYVVSGLVTAVPLILFGYGVRRIPLTTTGVFQYIAPSCAFFIGIFVYNEPFTYIDLISFGLIWLGLIFFTYDMYRKRKVFS